MFDFAKIQKSLEERNLLSKIPVVVRSLLEFKKDNSHRRVVARQKDLEILMRAIQETTSKAGMASGGFLGDLRGGLLSCLPVLERHTEFLKSQARRKEAQRSKEITNAADMATRNISSRETIKLFDIACKEPASSKVKGIFDALSGKEFYEPLNISLLLPVDRRRRFDLLHHILPRECSMKIGLWTFDNHGTAPQSVFAFLVILEDDFNTVVKKVMNIRPLLLAQQTIFYPREFLHQMKHFSSSIVDPTRAPVRMLMSMLLGDGRQSNCAVSKLLEERAVEAILTGDNDLAWDMRKFNGRKTEYLSFLSVVRETLTQFLAEDKNRWQNEYDGTIVSNMSMAYSLPALFKLCVEKALVKDPTMPIPSSEKFLNRYLYPRTTAAAAAVSTSEPLLALRWAVQQKVLEKSNPDSYYNMSQYKSLKISSSEPWK